MAVPMLTQRKIQNEDVMEERDAPLGWAYVSPRGRHKNERTSFIFDMVAELAIELASICVTRA
eukprot:6469379-Amphidinium_carterae.1